MKKRLFVCIGISILILLLSATAWAEEAALQPQQLLIDAADLHYPGAEGIVFIDARDQVSNSYIPHSIRIDWQSFYDGQTLIPYADIVEKLGDYGLTGKEKIVIYQDGPLAGHANLIFWLLDMVGHPQTQILRGGWPAYRAEGLSTSSRLAKLPAATFNDAPNTAVVRDMENMLTHFGDYDVVIVDPRSDEEYLGWALHGEARGGHIRTAVSFNPAWGLTNDGTVKDSAEIQKLLNQKGLTADKEIIIYSNLDARGADLYVLLRMLGYANVSLLGFTYNVWAEHELLPVSSAANWQAQVSPEWLHQLITTGSAPTYNNEKFVIIDCSWGPVEQAAKYQAAHIPGAIHFDTDTFEDERHYWDLFAFDELAPRLAAQGIDANTTVIVYSNEPTPISASCSFWALKYAGVDARLLNGNLDRWIAKGLPVESTINYPQPVEDFGRDTPLNPQYAISTEQAKELLADPNGRLVSVRSWPEYTGEVLRHSYIKDYGEPLGAYWARAGFGANKSDLSFYFDVDGSYRSYTEVTKMWADLDIQPNNQIAFFCGTGARASSAWFFSYLMGWPNTAVYDSGWFGWSEGQEVSPNPKQRLWDIVENQ